MGTWSSSPLRHLAPRLVDRELQQKTARGRERESGWPEHGLQPSVPQAVRTGRLPEEQRKQSEARLGGQTKASGQRQVAFQLAAMSRSILGLFTT